MAPTIPFWLGEAPSRTDELSVSVSRLRADVAERLRSDPAGEATVSWLLDDIGIAEPAARQLVEYLASALAALDCLPTQDTIVLERFFDEVGGMQLVIHSPYGSRVNRAWGLALRKRFCRKFSFELQAAATEDIVLAPAAHGFEVRRGCALPAPASVRRVLIRRCSMRRVWRPLALGDPGWRLRCAVPRRTQVAPQLAHGRRGLIGAVFDQIACARTSPAARDPRPSAGGSDHRRLSQRGDGHRNWSGCWAGSKPATSDRHPRSDPAVTAALEVLTARPMLISTTLRWRNAPRR
jgi:ATP-dependent Lhr-like helicase